MLRMALLGVLIGCLALAGLASPVIARQASADERAQDAAVQPAAVAEHANLVVVVRFSDDTAGDTVDGVATGYNAHYAYATGAGQESYTYWDQFRSWFGASGIEYFDGGTTSLASYMSMISYGAYHLTSYFPQSSSDGHTLAYITLPHDQSYYENAGDLQVVIDAAAIFNANAAWTSGSSSWGSGGALDNLELVVQVASKPGTSDVLLWPHKSNASGAVSFGGMKVYEYNFVNSKAVGDLRTVKHEYLHSAGLGDLYRVGDTGSAAGPVGIWDIMGTAAGQWPLAQSLVDLGFYQEGDIKTISGAGSHTVTLHTHFAKDGNGQVLDDGQAVKVYSPYSSDEYFVFEYRQKNNGQSDNVLTNADCLVPSSGLIVYRVNDAVDRDTNGHRTNRINDNGYYEDAIYVFRPGDTGIHDSAGDLQKAALSTSTYAYLGDAANTRTTFGSADMSKGIADGAIVDSSNTNSGIVVTVTAQADDSIAFDIEIPDYSSLSLWDTVGTAASAASADSMSTAVDSNGIIYQAFVDSDEAGHQSIRVRSWNGSTWTGLGTVASGSLGHAQLQCVGATLYCTYADYSSSGCAYRVATWNSKTSWTQAASVSTGGSYSNAPASAAIDGALYVLVDKDNTGLQLYKLSGALLSAVGTTLPVGYATETKVGIVGGKLAVICGDVGSSFSAKTGENIYVLSSATPASTTSWNKAFSEEANVARNLACASSGTSMLAFAAYDAGVTPQMRRVTSDGSVESHAFAAAGTNIQDASLAVNGGYAYLTVVDGNGLVTTWYSDVSDLSNWTELGTGTMSNAYANNSSLSSFVLGSKVYVGAIPSSATSATLLSHDCKQGKEATVLTLPGVPATTYTGKAIAYGGNAVVRDTSGNIIEAAGIKLEYLVDGSYTEAAPKDAGTWQVRATYAGSDAYLGSTATAAYVIGQAVPKITLAKKQAPYTGAAISLDAPVVEGVSADDKPTGAVATKYYTDAGCKTETTVEGSGAASAGAAPCAAGTYYAKATIAAAGNYASAASGIVTLEIAKKAVAFISLAGSTRYDTMLDIVDAEDVATGGSVVVASGSNFPDALAASALAGSLGAPIVLTDPAVLSLQARTAIEACAPRQVFIVGGEAAVAKDVAAALAALPSKPAVHRIAGTSRSLTASAIYSQGKGLYGLSYSADACIIATGRNASKGADALAISPYAYATKTPVFLAEDDGLLSAGTASAIESGGFKHVVICGGTGVVGDGVKAQLAQLGLAATYTRLGGETRFGTALAIAQWESGSMVSGAGAAYSSIGFKASDSGVNSGQTLSFATIAVATGANFPDALASAPLIGGKGGVLLLADPTDDLGGPAVQGTLASYGNAVHTCYFIGGDAALPKNVRSAVRGYVGA